MCERISSFWTVMRKIPCTASIATRNPRDEAGGHCPVELRAVEGLLRHDRVRGRIHSLRRRAVHAPRLAQSQPDQDAARARLADGPGKGEGPLQPKREGDANRGWGLGAETLGDSQAQLFARRVLQRDFTSV